MCNRQEIAKSLQKIGDLSKTSKISEQIYDQMGHIFVLLVEFMSEHQLAWRIDFGTAILGSQLDLAGICRFTGKWALFRLDEYGRELRRCLTGIAGYT